MRKLHAALGVILLILPLACGGSPFRPTDPNHVVGVGTVRFMTFEGGFWAIRGDDNVTYDPVAPLPAEFQRDGLRVRFEVKILPDLASIHMAGPVVEVVQIKKI